MRTVSFSQPQVARLFNDEFINVYSDTTGDPTAGASIGHAPRDPAGSCIRGNGSQNVQTIFLTPSGEIFHAATGYLSPEELAAEAQFALKLYQQMQDTSSPERVVVDAHRDRLKSQGFSDELIANRNPMLAMLSLGAPGMTRGNVSDPQSIFSGMIDQQILKDNQFSMNYPLMDWETLQADPTTLVGNGKSFFSSSSNSTQR